MALGRITWLINRGMLRRFQERLPEAATDLDEALRLSPHDIEVVPRRALLFLDQEDSENAISFLRKELGSGDLTTEQSIEFGYMPRECPAE